MKKYLLTVMLSLLLSAPSFAGDRSYHSFGSFTTLEAACSTSVLTSDAYDVGSYYSLRVFVTTAAPTDTAVISVDCQFSPDGTNWYTESAHTMTIIVAGKTETWYYSAVAKWFRIKISRVSGRSVTITKVFAEAKS
jgi:hypothetical protein